MFSREAVHSRERCSPVFIEIFMLDFQGFTGYWMKSVQRNSRKSQTFDTTDHTRLLTSPGSSGEFFYKLSMRILWPSCRESLIGDTDWVFVKGAVCSKGCREFDNTRRSPRWTFGDLQDIRRSLRYPTVEQRGCSILQTTPRFRRSREP